MSEENSILNPPSPRKEYNIKSCDDHDNSNDRIRDFVSQALPTFTNHLTNIHVACEDCGMSCGYGFDGKIYEVLVFGGKAWQREMSRIDKQLNDAGITKGPSIDEL